MTKRILNRAIPFILLLLSCGGGQASLGTKQLPFPEKPNKYSNLPGRFRIQFPGKPDSTSLNIPLEPGGFIKMHAFTFSKGINYVYCLTYADYPETFDSKTEERLFLNILLSQYIDVQRAGLESEKSIEVGGNPGIHFLASNGDIFVIGEFILNSSRLFQLTVSKEGGYPNEADANAFLESLELM